MKYKCKCGCTDMFVQSKGNNIGLYCKSCGKWQKWLNKDEFRAFEYNMREATYDKNTIVDRLNEFINFLDKEIDKTLKQKDRNDTAKYTYTNTCENIKNNLINIVDGRRYYDEYE